MKIPDTRSFVLCALLGASLVLPAGAIAQSDTESGFPGDSNPFVRKTRTDSLDAIFNPATLGETTLEFTLDEWNKLLGYYDRNPRNETEVSGTYTFAKDGRVWRFEQTGIRLRGSGIVRLSFAALGSPAAGVAVRTEKGFSAAQSSAPGHQLPPQSGNEAQASAE